jgi:hypothetical protein
MFTLRNQFTAMTGYGLCITAHCTIQKALRLTIAMHFLKGAEDSRLGFTVQWALQH